MLFGGTTHDTTQHKHARGTDAMYGTCFFDGGRVRAVQFHPVLLHTILESAVVERDEATQRSIISPVSFPYSYTSTAVADCRPRW